MSGYVVEHKELPGTRFAVSEANFDPKRYKKVRDLKPGETVQGYRPRRKDTQASPQETQPGNGSGAGSPGAASDAKALSSDSQRDPKTT